MTNGLDIGFTKGPHRSLILVVEDNAFEAELIRDSLLLNDEYLPERVSSGEKALEYVAKRVPEVVIMDVVLSGQLNGFETARLLYEGYGLPIVFLTSIDAQENIRYLDEAKPFAYIVKPFNSFELNAAVKIALTKSKAELRVQQIRDEVVNTLNSLSEAILTLDINFSVTMVNKSARNLIGIKSENVIGKSIENVLTLDGKGCSLLGAELKKIIGPDGNAVKNEAILITATGEKRDIEYRAAALFDTDANVHGVVISCNPIEQRLKKEKLLRFMKKALDTSHVGITVTDPNGSIIYVNPAEALLHGYARDDLIGKDVGILAPKELRNPLSIEQLKSLQKRDRESINIRRDGTRFPVFLKSDVVFDNHGAPQGMVTISEDITQRKYDEVELNQYRDHLEELVDIRTEELRSINIQLHREIAERKRTNFQLRHSEKRYRLLVERTSDGILQLDYDWNVTFVSDGASKILGYDKNELLNKSLNELFQFDSENKADYTKAEDGSREIQLKRGDGKNVIILLRKTPLLDENNCFLGTMVILTDITQRKSAESERTQREKLQGILEMAGAVCHEFTQPVQIMSATLQLLQKNMKKSGAVESYAKIQEQIDRISQSISKLRQITIYKTKEYVDGLEIFDLDNSSPTYIPEQKNSSTQKSSAVPNE